MDDLDRALIDHLRRDGRASHSVLADALGVTRSTVRARLNRLEAAGELLGYTVVLREDVRESAIRGLTLLEIEGRGTERIIAALSRLPGVEAVHTTNGRWDLIVELGAGSPEGLDDTLKAVRLIEGVSRSETSLILRTRTLRRARR